MNTVLEIAAIVSLCFLVGTLCTAHLYDVLHRKVAGQQAKPAKQPDYPSDTVQQHYIVMERENTDLRTERKTLLREIDELRQVVIRVRDTGQAAWDMQQKETQRLKKELDKSHQRERHLEAQLDRATRRV